MLDTLIVPAALRIDMEDDWSEADRKAREMSADSPSWESSDTELSFDSDDLSEALGRKTESTVGEDDNDEDLSDIFDKTSDDTGETDDDSDDTWTPTREQETIFEKKNLDEKLTSI